MRTMFALLPLDSRRLRLRYPSHFCVGPSLGGGAARENRQIPLDCVMEINEGPVEDAFLRDRPA
jgi:hypothetical protein